MAYQIKRSDKEIDELLDQCADSAEKPSKFFGMSYEQGIQYGIEWLLGETEDHPLE